MNFKEYKDKFEKEIINRGLDLGLLGTNEQVSVKRTKMDYTHFADIMGVFIDSFTIFAIDYYGYTKKSRGFIDSLPIRKTLLKGKQLKSIKAPVIHFASIKMEDVARLNKELLSDFPTFKDMILKARGFKGENNG